MSKPGALLSTLAGAAIGAALSVHPASTNAKLAISSKAKDIVFMSLLLLLMSGLCEVNWGGCHPLAKQECRSSST